MNASASGATSTRLVWVDYVKGMSISAIVIYHVMVGLETSELVVRGTAFQVLSDLIGVTGMPMFFFMSGMFVIRGAYRKPRPFLAEKLKTLVYPYFLWVLIYAAIQYMAGSSVNHPIDITQLWRAIYLPPWHYWFMYVMFVLCLLFVIAARLRIPPAAMLALGAVLYLLHGNVNMGPWVIPYMVSQWLVFFALGGVINGRGPILWISHAQDRLLIGIIAVALPAAVMALYLGVKDVPPTQIVLFVPGGLFMLSTAILLRRHNVLRIVEHIGRRSMAVYVAHVIPLAATRIVLLKLGVESVLLHAVLGSLAGILGPYLLAETMERLNFPYLFTLKKSRTLQEPTSPERIQVSA